MFFEHGKNLDDHSSMGSYTVLACVYMYEGSRLISSESGSGWMSEGTISILVCNVVMSETQVSWYAIGGSSIC